MKVIDLLNKIANGEETPRKFIFDDDEFYLQSKNCYRCDETRQIFEECFIFEDLNKEIEIIEEDEKDEEIEIYVNNKKVDITDIYEPLKQGEYVYKENGKWYVHKLKNVSFVIEKDKKIEKLEHMNSRDYLENRDEYLSTKDIALDIETLRHWINKIIDYLKENK